MIMVMVTMVTMEALQVSTYLEKGKVMKPQGFGDMSKVSTSTCMVCLQPPSSYNKVRVKKIQDIKDLIALFYNFFFKTFKV